MSKLKIGATLFQPILPKQTKKEKSPDVEVGILQQMTDSKQALKEAAQRQIAEIQEARTDMGEDDPKAQRLIEKFKNGKKLTPEEMTYVRKNAPGIVDYIDRIMREREVIEQSMKIAPTKTDVQLVAFRVAKQIEKHPNPEEREIRAKHLADAKQEYEQTEEYKEKPNSPLENRERPANISYKKNPKQYEQIAKIAYDQTMPKKRASLIEFEQ